MKGLQI